MEVVATDSFVEWYDGLSQGEADAVTSVVDLLEAVGVKLGYPHSSAIKGSSIALRELRATENKAELRVFYAFDPARDAVLLIGGSKSGDAKFYERMIEKAEKEWREYLADNFPTK
jgi:hypothetical protein